MPHSSHRIHNADKHKKNSVQAGMHEPDQPQPQPSKWTWPQVETYKTDAQGHSQSTQETQEAEFALKLKQVEQQAYVQGFEQAEKNFKLEFERQQHCFEQLLSTLRSKVNNDSSEQENRQLIEHCLSLAYTMTQQLLQRELEVKACELIPSLTNLLQGIDMPVAKVQVFICEADLAVMQQHPAWQSVAEHCRFIIDDRLGPGDLCVETEQQFFDGRMQEKLKTLMDSAYAQLL